jgi:SAM-dependent methyltransferase
MTRMAAKLQSASKSNKKEQVASQNAEKVPDWKDTALQDIEYHRRQFEQPYRSTEALGRFVQSIITNVEGEGEALDVACGAGANILHLGRILRNYRWSGIDIAGEVLFPISHPIFDEHSVSVNLVAGDFYKLTEIFEKKKFDLVFSVQTLLTLPSYEGALDQLLAVTRNWLFITGLFTDFNIDAKIKVMDYSWPVGTHGPYYYSVYGLERFRSYCEERGCLEFVSQDFEIDIDLSPPEAMGFGTYTQTTADGRRLQFTGPIFEPWKFIAIRMGNQ